MRIRRILHLLRFLVAKEVAYKSTSLPNRRLLTKLQPYTDGGLEVLGRELLQARGAEAFEATFSVQLRKSLSDLVEVDEAGVGHDGFG